MADTTLLKIEHIRKEFTGVVALDDVSFDIKKGEVHVVIGENGAGKSTLVKIISGLFSLDHGALKLEGEDYHPANVRDAQAKGINMIHQELNLLDNRTVAQNIFIGEEPIKNGLLNTIDVKKMNDECQALLSTLGLDYIKPTDMVKDLSIAQQQMVEVAKALSHDSKLLIMDEPTSSLTVKEIESLFKLIRQLRSEGVSIIYISHRMEELIEIGDRVTVMRDGKYIDTLDAKNIKLEELITLMVGRKITNLYNRTFNEPGEVVLQTDKLTGLRFRNIDISVRRGEIVGLAGLIGAGRTELVKALFGYEPLDSGNISLFGSKLQLKRWTPLKAVNNSIALLPEDRKGEGLILTMPIKNNIIQASLKKRFPSGIVSKTAEDELATDFVDKLRIVTPSIEQTVMNLSGGNQQKVVLAKWLATECNLIIFDEPTRGIDVGAKSEIYELMNELAKNGNAILMISSEQMEIVNLVDRVYVMKDGEISGELDRKNEPITQESIIKLIMGRK